MDSESIGAELTLTEMKLIVRNYLYALGVPFSDIKFRDIDEHVFELSVPIWGVHTPDGASVLRLNVTYTNPSAIHDPHHIEEKVKSSACFLAENGQAIDVPCEFSNGTQLRDYLERFIMFDQASTSEILDKQRETTEKLKVMDKKLDSILSELESYNAKLEQKINPCTI